MMNVHTRSAAPTGIAKVLVNKDTEELLGVHIIGLHAADLIQECANAMAAKTTVRELSYMVRPFPRWRGCGMWAATMACSVSPTAPHPHNTTKTGAHPPHALRGAGRGVQGRRRPHRALNGWCLIHSVFQGGGVDGWMEGGSGGTCRRPSPPPNPPMCCELVARGPGASPAGC